jgi:hypothetical protein
MAVKMTVSKATSRKMQTQPSPISKIIGALMATKLTINRIGMNRMPKVTNIPSK